MPADTVIALVLFATLMVSTPGPANILAMAAGARWGLAPCLPFVAGLTCGKALLNIMMALGLLAALAAHAAAAQVLQIVSGLYLLYLAWRIAGMRLQKRGAAPAHKPGFFAGLIVHPLNPKAWAMSTAAYAQYADSDGNWFLQSAVIVAVFIIVELVAHPLWCYGGSRLAATLAGTVWERALMRVMGLMVAALALWAMAQNL